MTIYEIAKKAKVSIATISRAINPKMRAKVSRETLEKIDRLILQHGYTPNLAARHLCKTDFETIGVLMPQHAGIFLEDYYAQVLAGVSDALLESGYQFKLVMLKCKKEKWDKYNFKFAEGVDGLIVTHWNAFFSHASAFEKMSVPCVVINDPEPKTRVHFVSGDHQQGGVLAAEYLYSQGHRKIAVLTGPRDSADSSLRVKGFQSFLSQRGLALNPEWVACGEFQEEKAFEVMGGLLKKRRDFTAVFCCNDGMAFGALRRLAEEGIACPGKISVMGYDNDKRGESCSPPLTSVRVPLYELAQEAGNKLVRYLRDKKARDFFYQETLYPVQRVERQSVKKIQ